MVAGFAQKSRESLVLWDTLCPPRSACVAVCSPHDTGASALAVLPDCAGPGPPHVATGGEGGDVAVTDFRRVAAGQTARATVWHSAGQRPHVCSSGGCGSERRRAQTAARDGLPRRGHARVGAGKGEQVQEVKCAHEKHTFLNPKGGGLSTQAAITSLHGLDGGVLSTGGDGIVRLHRCNLSWAR